MIITVEEAIPRLHHFGIQSRFNIIDPLIRPQLAGVRSSALSPSLQLKPLINLFKNKLEFASESLTRYLWFFVSQWNKSPFVPKPKKKKRIGKNHFSIKLVFLLM